MAGHQLDNVTRTWTRAVRAAIFFLFKCFEQDAASGARGRQAVRRRRARPPGCHGVGGPPAGELYWKPLRHDMVLFTLHNPRDAGAYFTDDARRSPTLHGHTRTVVKPA